MMLILFPSLQIKRLFELRSFVSEITPIVNRRKRDDIPTLSDSEWFDLDKALQVLQITYNATIKLQAAQITLSDYFAIWINMKLKLNKLNNLKLAHDINEKLDERERVKQIMESPPVLASVFIDSRYRVLLTPAQKLKAREHLTEVWHRYRKIREPKEGESNECTETENGGHPGDLMELLNEKARLGNDIYFGNDEHALKRIDLLPQQRDLNDSVLQFWYRQRESEPILYEIACIINASAPTQTTVERAFSSFSYVLNSYRNSLSDENIDNVLTVKQNKDLFDVIKLK